jgi:hypothetical protein
MSLAVPQDFKQVSRVRLVHILPTNIKYPRDTQPTLSIVLHGKFASFNVGFHFLSRLNNQSRYHTSQGSLFS